MPDHQRIIRRTNEMLGRSQPGHLRTVPPASGECNHSLAPQHDFTAMNHNFHDMPNYPHGFVPGRSESLCLQNHLPNLIFEVSNASNFNDPLSIPPNCMPNNAPQSHRSSSAVQNYLCLQNHHPNLNIEVSNVSNFNDPWSVPPSNCMPNYAPQSHSSSAAAQNHGFPIQESYVGYFTYRQTTPYLVEQHSVMNAVGEYIWTGNYSECTETANFSFSHGNYIHRISPMQAMRRNNYYNIQPQVPSSSHGDRINDPQPDYTANSSWDRPGSRNRNFMPDIPVDQMPGQNTLLPEDNILDRLGYLTIDDVLLLQSGTNSNVSSSRINDEETIIANGELFELVEIDELIDPIDMGLSRQQILRHLKTRAHISSSDEEPEICVICQAEYACNEEIGTLQCRHCFHAECIQKWLQQKNICPICKAMGLAISG
ncbi:RING-type E3 ubiquitin transferase [Sarracenia purpurea var. burkii]